MKSKLHEGCGGMIRRNGWGFESIDGHSWCVPNWKCDKCGAEYWSYFDHDNGDKGYDTEAEEEAEEEE